MRSFRTERPRQPVAAAAGAGLLTVAVAIVVTTLALRPGAAPAASDAVATQALGSVPVGSTPPAASTVSDGTFRLELRTPSSAYRTVDEIEPVATITYLGPDPTKTIFHGASPLLFRIEEIDGPRVMNGGMDEPCLRTVLTKDVPAPYPFEKSGSPTDDPAAGFDRAWYEDRQLRLPAGRWRIVAELRATLGDCGAGAEEHALAASIELDVRAETAGTEPVTAAVDDGMFRLVLTTPRGLYGPDDVIEPIARVTYLGPQAETTMFHGGSPIGFMIEEVGGDRRMDGAMTQPCLHTPIEQDIPLVYPFVKSGAIGESFERAWFDEPSLRLPLGTWRIRAFLIIDVSDGTTGCGGIGHNLDIDNVIVVAEDGSIPTVAPTPIQTPRPTPISEPGTLRPSTGPPSEDGSFRLEISIPKDAYLTTEAIEPIATLTYLGSADRVEYGHSDPALFFTIAQLDGDALMTGGAADSCTVTTIGRDESVQVQFHKSGQVGLGFDVSWFRDPVLRLPPGTWLISARFEGGIPACEAGGARHELRADRVITVR